MRFHRSNKTKPSLRLSRSNVHSGPLLLYRALLLCPLTRICLLGALISPLPACGIYDVTIKGGQYAYSGSVGGERRGGALAGRPARPPRPPNQVTETPGRHHDFSGAPQFILTHNSRDTGTQPWPARVRLCVTCCCLHRYPLPATSPFCLPCCLMAARPTVSLSTE